MTPVRGPLSESFHPAPKPGHSAPQPAKQTPKPKTPPKKAPPPKKKPKPKPKKKPVSAQERQAYAQARARCQVAGGFICEACGGHIKEGSEHAHHIIYGRLHGTRSAMTDPDLIAITHGDFTEERCHHKAHQTGTKDLSAFPFWKGNPQRFETLAT